MKIAKNTACDTFSSELDMSTIRRRVAQIKSQWSPDVVQARAAEGARRRRELDFLVSQLLGESCDRPCSDTHGLTLVG